MSFWNDETLLRSSRPASHMPAHFGDSVLAARDQKYYAGSVFASTGHRSNVTAETVDLVVELGGLTEKDRRDPVMGAPRRADDLYALAYQRNPDAFSQRGLPSPEEYYSYIKRETSKRVSESLRAAEKRVADAVAGGAGPTSQIIGSLVAGFYDPIELAAMVAAFVATPLFLGGVGAGGVTLGRATAAAGASSATFSAAAEGIRQVGIVNRRYDEAGLKPPNALGQIASSAALGLGLGAAGPLIKPAAKVLGRSGSKAVHAVRQAPRAARQMTNWFGTTMRGRSLSQSEIGALHTISARMVRYPRDEKRLVGDAGLYGQHASSRRMTDIAGNLEKGFSYRAIRADPDALWANFRVRFRPDHIDKAIASSPGGWKGRSSLTIKGRGGFGAVKIIWNRDSAKNTRSSITRDDVLQLPGILRTDPSNITEDEFGNVISRSWRVSLPRQGGRQKEISLVMKTLVTDKTGPQRLVVMQGPEN